MTKENRIFVGLYVFCCVLLLPLYINYIDAADAIQYLELSREYAGRGFQNVSSYWSPLLSVLLIPFVHAKLNLVAGMKIIQCLASLYIYSFSLHSLQQNQPTRILRIAYAITLAILLLSYALLWGTPDLLFLALLLKTITVISGKKEKSRLPQWLVLGILGALLYFTKAIGFYVFIVLCLIFAVMKYREEKKGVIFLHLVAAFLTFLLLLSPWVYAISKQEGKLNIGTAADYNRNILSPALNPDVYGELQHPMSKDTLIAAPSGYSSSWISPDKYTIKKWQPLEGKENLHWYKKIVWRNLQSIRSFYFGADAGLFLLLGMVLLLLFTNRPQLFTLLKAYKNYLLVALVLTMGYSLIFVQPRYLWWNEWLILLLAAGVIHIIYHWHKAAGILLLILTFGTAIYQPLKELYIHSLEGKEIKTLAENNKISGNIITLHSALKDDYTVGTAIAYYSGSQYLGRLDLAKRNAAQLMQQLNIHQVNWIIAMENKLILSLYGELLEEVSVDGQQGIHLYKVKTRK